MFIFTKVDNKIYKLFKEIAKKYNKSVYEFLNIVVIY